jgi:hypothetical protein
VPKDPAGNAPTEGGTTDTPAPARGPLFGRRELAWGAGALVLLAVVLTAVGVRFPSIGGLGPSAPVEINFEHSLRSGTLKVYVDDALVLEEALESWVKDDLVVMKVRKGRLNKTFSVPAGDRVLRLEVEGEGFHGSRTLEARFEAGEARRLEVRLGGLVKKDLSAWMAARKPS